MAPELPPGFVALPLGKGCICVIPERVYIAGLRFGKQFRRRAAHAQRKATSDAPPVVASGGPAAEPA